MNPARWKQIEELWCAALALDAGERDAFLERMCAGDPELRREVDSLLSADEQAADFLTPSKFGLEFGEAAAGQAHSLVGRTVAHYEILSRVGAGAMGEVYLARDSKLGRLAALKVLPPQFTRDSERLQRFVREARAASALNHPNIMTIYEVGEDGDTQFIAGEFIEGVTLRDRLAGGRMDPLETLDIAIQCAAALGAGHQGGIVHRDVKPENIMVRKDGLVKVIDFGLARITDSREGPARTLPGLVIGTPRYMSPEQARGQQLDARTDIFSLGAVLYEMAAGEPRFAGDTTADIFVSLLGAESPSPDAAMDKLPEELEPIARRALDRDRDRRYQTMEDFGRDLGRLKRRLESGKGEDATVRRRSRWVIAATALVSVAILVAVVFALRPSRMPAQPLVPVPLTSDPGSEFEPRLSPDGGRVAYTRAGAASPPEVVIQAIGSSPSPLVVLEPQTFSPAWSPRGDSLAVLRIRSEASNRRDVLLVTLPRGAPRKIAEVDTPGPIQVWAPGPYLDFSPDGRFLVAVDGWGIEEHAGLVLISTETGDKFRLTTPAGRVIGDLSPRFSPDGTRIAFTRLLSFGAAALHILDLTNEMRPAALPKRIASRDLWNAFPAWTPDGRNLLFAGGEMHAARLKMVRATGAAEPIPLPLAGAGVSPLDLRPSAAPGTSRIAYTRIAQNDDIFRVSLGEPAAHGVERATTVADSSYIDELPRCSPDGSKMVFSSNRRGSMQLWVASSDGSEPRQLSSLESAVITHPAWSPDSRRLAVALTTHESTGIFEVDTDDGRMRRLVDGEVDYPEYSVDGRWLYFGARWSGELKTWRIPALGGAPELVEALPSPAWFSPDGKAVVYAKGLDVFMKPLSGGPSTQLFSAIFSHQSVAVGRSAAFALARTATDGPWALYAWRFADHRAAPILIYERRPGNGISISPDERHAYLTQREHTAVDLMLLDGVDLSRY
ncbi:MAG: PD40 domain-containing protein [Bryobacteraceae bacterium]|nr:PD40 domain-containing protein [Bryobacteraceae bacterium]